MRITDITNEEYEHYLKQPKVQQTLKDSSNWILCKYGNFLSIDDLKECKLIALWEVLKIARLKPDINIYSYLYNRVKWRCFKKMAEKSKFHRSTTPLMTEPRDHRTVDAVLVNLCEGLPTQYYEILRQRYVDRMTLKEIGKKNGYTYETARVKISKAIKRLKELEQT